MLRLGIIKVSWFIALIAICVNGYAHDTDGFFVIPVPSGKIVEREVCNGTPVGNVLFTITENRTSFITTGDVFSTTNGTLVEITGIANDTFVGGIQDKNDYDIYTYIFRSTPNSLPSPQNNGVKGPYYFLNRGKIAYARFL